MKNRIGIFHIALTVLSVLSGAAPGSPVRNVITLRTVAPMDVPVIEAKTLRVMVDLKFDQCPQEYWIHYNEDAGRLVIEFFGYHVDAPKVKISGTTVISDLRVVNSETVFALNGKSSQVSMQIDKGWHYDSWIIGGKVLRIQLWMFLDPSRVLEAEKKRPFLPILIISIVTASITTGILLGLTTRK